MKKVFFISGISLIMIFIFSQIRAQIGTPECNIVPTFNSAGIYWTTSSAPEQPKGEVYYRVKGETNWLKGYEIYWLPREDGNSEFRGSLVRLKSGTEYDIRLVSDTEEKLTSFKTWSEDFKIKKVIQIEPEMKGFSTSEGGSESEGYVVYEPASGSDSTISANKAYSIGIDVKHDWVIIRGWKIKGIRNYPVKLHSKQQYAVVEYCDISDWGVLGKNFATNSYGIFLDGEDLIPSNIVIQHNYFHDPTYDTNNWSEPADKASAGYHPGGTQAMWMTETGGEMVIRYNTITGSPEHYYNDAMGEWRNFGPHGFPYRDSDIHNNYISHCWDNCIEAEGGNMNVRIYENFTDSSYAHYGLSNITFGPLYLFNNVSNVGHKYPTDFTEASFLKIGNKLKYDSSTGLEWPAVGRAYVFHNTILQPEFDGRNRGICIFTTSSGPSNGVIFLNNLMYMSGNKSVTYPILSLNENSVTEYNMYYNGYLMITGDQNNYVKPEFNPQKDGFFLKSGTKGFDGGRIIQGFNDDFFGEAPDIGAYESGNISPEFGCGFDKISIPKVMDKTSEINIHNSQNDMSIYPNPFSNGVNINVFVDNPKEVKFQIIDTSGILVYSVNPAKLHEGTNRIFWNGFFNNGNEAPQGLYLVSFQNGSNRFSTRICKQ